MQGAKSADCKFGISIKSVQQVISDEWKTPVTEYITFLSKIFRQKTTSLENYTLSVLTRQINEWQVIRIIELFNPTIKILMAEKPKRRIITESSKISKVTTLHDRRLRRNISCRLTDSEVYMNNKAVNAVGCASLPLHIFTTIYTLKPSEKDKRSTTKPLVTNTSNIQLYRTEIYFPTEIGTF